MQVVSIMQSTVVIMGRELTVSLSERASRELSKRSIPLIAEMELYFSCLIRKKVRFHDSSHGLATVQVVDNLNVAFHPVMTAACGKDYEGDEPPVTDFPIHNPESFVPYWLNIDYRHNQWQGDFGFRKNE
jgi:hypothetical protein